MKCTKVAARSFRRTSLLVLPALRHRAPYYNEAMPAAMSSRPLATSLSEPAFHSRQHVVTRAAAVAPSVSHKAAPAEALTTTGTVRYTKQPPAGEGLNVYVYELPEGVDKASNLEYDVRDVTVTDLHSATESFSLERNGFVLEKLEVPKDIDWDNKEEVQQKYYPVVEQMLKRVTGATRTLIFDHTLRNGRIKQSKDELEAPGKPVPSIHVDYTTLSGYERLDALVPKEEAEQLKKTPFAVVQVWRPLKGPVDDSPLGMIDASTVDKDDLLPYAIHFPGRTGWNYAVKENPNHRFYYAKGMDVDEAYVFVCYDSRAGRARFTPHTGFLDHNTSVGAPPRESVELRSYCFWENDEPQQAARDL